MNVSDRAAKAMLNPPEAEPVMPASVVVVIASLTSVPGMNFSIRQLPGTRQGRNDRAEAVFRGRIHRGQQVPETADLEPSANRCATDDHARIRTLKMPTSKAPSTAQIAATWAQIVSDRLGYGVDEIEVLHGDTSVVPLGMDTYGSRSLAVGGVALYHAAERIVEKARRIAAHRLGVDEGQLKWADGSFTGPDGSISLKEIAFHAWTAHDLPDGMEPGLEATYVYDPPNFSWPGGAHIAVVEVDTETGAVECSATSRSTSRRRHESDDRRGQSTAASRRESRRPSTKRRSTTRTRTC